MPRANPLPLPAQSAGLGRWGLRGGLGVSRPWWWCVTWVLLWASTGGAWAQSGGVGGIYTCVDNRGRRITSDRPIAECLDREQRELYPYGGVRRTIPPSLTADERAVVAAQEREEAVALAKLSEERRQDRALLARYQSAQAHDRERAKQLKAQQQTQTMIQQQTQSLQQERANLEAELEFYKADPSKAPATLRYRLKDNTEQQTSQQRRMAAQQDEVARINARFDEELKRLKRLWGNASASR